MTLSLVLTVLLLSCNGRGQKSEQPPSGSQPTPSKTYQGRTVTDGGDVSGTIVYRGPIPPPLKITINRDADVCGESKPDRPLIKLDSRGCVAEAVVFIVNIREGKQPSRTDAPARIDQLHCEFRPHVLAVLTGAKVEVLNSDDTPHNINGTHRGDMLFNVFQPQKAMKWQRRFEQPGVITIKCHVHNWMSAYVHVFDHPYFAITDQSGSFSLKNIPAGQYKLGVWQEYLGEQTFEVTIESGKTTQFEANLQPKPGK